MRDTGARVGESLFDSHLSSISVPSYALEHSPTPAWSRPLAALHQAAYGLSSSPHLLFPKKDVLIHLWVVFP
jgi:hypothetical protein